MKVTPEHLAVLRAGIAPLDTPERRDRYKRGDYPNAAATTDLDTRYRWDLLYAARMYVTVQAIYAYANDDHIDTALRAIVPRLA